MVGSGDVKFWWCTATVGFLIGMLGALGVYLGITSLGRLLVLLGWIVVIISIVVERLARILEVTESDP